MVEAETRDTGAFVAPMSYGQQRLWTLDRIDGGSTTYNVSRAFRLRGPLDVRAFQDALEGLVARHEILRTRFELVDGTPMQIVADSIDVPFELVNLADHSHAERERRGREIVDDAAARTFDLSRGPLVRATLVRLDSTDYLALFAMHHIVTDEWSSGIFDREFAELYEARLLDRAPELNEMPIQYADYANWQRESLDDGTLAGDLTYWRAVLAGAPERTALSSYRREDIDLDAGSMQTIEISATTSQALRELGSSHGTTSFVALLAAFYTLLYRYTGQSDLVVGSPIAQREREELETLIGFFVNTVALRSIIDPRENFYDLLNRVAQTMLGAFEHQFVPFERVVADLNLHRPGASVPLINVFFRADGARAASLELAGLNTEAIPLENVRAKFDLDLSVRDLGSGMRCTLRYRTALFDSAFIARMAANFATLLDSIVASPSTSLAELSVLSECERLQVIEGFNDTETDYPRDRTLLDLLDSQLDRTPSAIALEWEDDDERSVTLDFAELHARAAHLADRLRMFGVAPGVGVGIALERSAELVVSLLAVFKAGGFYVPLDPDYPADRLTFMLADSGVSVLITDSRLRLPFAGSTAHVVLVDVASEPLAAEPPSASRPKPSDLAYMIYTSGSTGRPKGALNRHAGIVNRLMWMQERFAATPSDVILHKTTFSFDVSLWELLWPLISGARLLLARPGGQRDTRYIVDLVARRGATYIHFVPSMLRLFINAGDVGKCRSLTHIICSGEALPADLLMEVRARHPAQIHNLYGPTETAIEVTHFTPPPDFAASTVPIGRPIANTRAYVLDSNRQPVPLGARGELYIGGVQVGAGYHDRPELTAEKFVPDPFAHEAGARLYRTGDFARYGEDGAIEYLGRIDSQVKIGGVRIELGEIENALRRVDDVRDAAVVVRGEGSSARIVAYVVSEATRMPDEWQTILAKDLPFAMLPRVVVLAKLPLTPNGKLDYRALPDPELEPARTSHEPANILNYQLIDMWESALGRSPIDTRENFFSLGGTSLLAVQLLAEMSRTFDYALSPASFFEDPTIAHVAKILLEKPTEFLASPLVTLQPLGSLAPFFFVDGDLHGGGYYVRGLARRLAEDRPLYALHMPGTQGSSVPITIEAAATTLLSHIKTVRPHGPYALGGFCAGALIAHEIARILQERGETVEGLLIVESLGSNARLARFAETTDGLLQRLRLGDSRRFAIRTAIARYANRAKRMRGRLSRLRHDPGGFIRNLPTTIRNRFVSRSEHEEIETSYNRLTIDYIPRRSRVGITLLLVERDGISKGHVPQWHHVADRVERDRLSGSHLSCITRYIDDTALVINRHLSKTAVVTEAARGSALSTASRTDSPLVSIVVSAYNRPAMLEKALESIRLQRYRNLEIIVQDDSTNDACYRVVEAFDDSRVRYTHNMPPLGTAANLRSGYRKALGTYFCTLNDDDILAPSYVDQMVAHLEADPRIAVAFSDHYIIDGSGDILHDVTEKNTRFWKRHSLPAGLIEDPLELAIVNKSIPAMFAMFRRSSVDLDDFPDDVSSGYDFWLSYLAVREGNPVHFSPERLASYREHPQSQTASFSEPTKSLLFCRYIAYAHRRFLADPRLAPIHRSLTPRLASAHGSAGFALVRLSDPHGAFEEFAKSWQVRRNFRALIGFALCAFPPRLAAWAIRRKTTSAALFPKELN